MALLPLVQAATPDANTLIRALARPAPAITHYHEVRFIGLLKAPLVLQGTLEYHDNEQLLKQVDMPYHETTRITGTEVEVTRAGKSTRRFSLKHAPELEGFLASFSALLAGDMERLGKFYTFFYKWRCNTLAINAHPQRKLAEATHSKHRNYRHPQHVALFYRS